MKNKQELQKLNEKISDLRKEINVYEDIIALDKNKSWQAIRDLFEKRIQEVKNNIFNLDVDAVENWDKNSDKIRCKIIEIQAIENILNMPQKYIKLSEKKSSLLSSIKDKLKKLKIKKRGADRIKY